MANQYPFAKSRIDAYPGSCKVRRRRVHPVSAHDFLSHFLQGYFDAFASVERSCFLDRSQRTHLLIIIIIFTVLLLLLLLYNYIKALLLQPLQTCNAEGRETVDFCEFSLIHGSFNTLHSYISWNLADYLERGDPTCCFLQRGRGQNMTSATGWSRS